MSSEGMMGASQPELERRRDERNREIVRRASVRTRFHWVGKSFPASGAKEKVLGLARFGADQSYRDAVYVKIVRSRYPHALIKSIDAANVLKTPGVVTVITAKDIPGINDVSALFSDQPLIAERKVRYLGDSVALVVAEDSLTAEEAAENLEVQYEPLQPVFSPLEALKPGAPQVYEGTEVNGNEVKTGHFEIKKGDVAKGFKEADVIVENTYRTQAQEHAYLEPEASAAIPNHNGSYTIIASTQYPYLAQYYAAKILGLKADKIRVIQAATGGSFGGRDTMWGETKCALAAFKTNRPAVLVQQREEAMTGSTVRHPFTLRYKMGAAKDGKLTALEAELTADTGAYEAFGSGILWRATAHSTGPYVIPNVKVTSRMVFTNNTPSAAFRGFGNPQVTFAVESQMDELAEKLGIDPAELRLKNIVRRGSTTGPGQLLESSVGLEACLKLALKEGGWKKKRVATRSVRGHKKRGIGVAVMFHGISVASEPGGFPDYARAMVQVNRDSSVTYRSGIVELGQGSQTAHSLMVADILGVSLDRIRLESTDTSTHPESGITAASRGTFMGGNAAIVAATEVLDKLLKQAAELLNCRTEDVEISKDRAFRKSNPSRSIPFEELAEKSADLSASSYFAMPRIDWKNEVGHGETYHSFTFGAVVTEVEVDLETGQLQVLKITPVLDVGKVINPLTAEGQVEGGTILALGYGTMEELVHRDGRVLNPNLADYYLPTSLDSPEITTRFVEDRCPTGPFGAKGLGEPPVVAPAASIANAVYHATGVRITELPITSEKIYLALKKRSVKKPA